MERMALAAPCAWAIDAESFCDLKGHCRLKKAYS